MLIVQISDLHIAPHGQKTLGTAPMAENLARCIAQINNLSPTPDLVIITGDITHNGTLAETSHAADLLRLLSVPYYIIPGNHDDRDTLWSVFGGTAIPSSVEGFLSYAVDTPNLRLIALDSLKEGQPGGELCAKRAAWLEKQMRTATDRPVALFMHHPPCKFGVAESDVDGFDGADRLGQIVAGHKNLVGIYCGHIHLAAHCFWQGTMVSTAPSMGMRLNLDLTLESPSQYYLDAPGYQLHMTNAEQQPVTHTAYIRDENGPHGF